MCRNKVVMGFRMEANDRGEILLRDSVMLYYILCPTETNFFQQYHKCAGPSTALAGHDTKLYGPGLQFIEGSSSFRVHKVYSTYVPICKHDFQEISMKLTL